MTAYLDASVLVPLFVFEPSSPVVRRWVADRFGGGITTSRWGAVEFASAVGNRVRRGDLTAIAGSAAIAAFEREFVEALTLEEAVPEDLDFARRAIAHFDRGLRGGDALHVAIALRIDAALLVASDRRLADAARAFGLDAAEPA